MEFGVPFRLQVVLVVCLFVLLLWMAMVDKGATSGGGAMVVMVDLGDAATAGSLVEAGCGCRGRTRSSSFGSVAGRRTASATFYMLERLPLPGGWWYGGAAVA